MINITYKCSNGDTFDLVGDKLKVTGKGLHRFEWEPDKVATKYGDVVYGFTKDSISYKTVLTLRGSLDERKEMLNHLSDCFEHDIVNATPGIIYFGDYYIECYIKESQITINSKWNNWTDNDITIYCPYPFWTKDDKKSFYPGDADIGEEYEFLDYNYGYNYDYSTKSSGSQTWYIDHFKDSNFEMIIYGGCINPRITINDKIYQINDSIESGEYIKINSKNKTVTKHLSNGTTQNIFHKREKSSSVFELLPPGNLTINWTGTYGIDITAFIERSVPQWT